MRWHPEGRLTVDACLKCRGLYDSARAAVGGFCPSCTAIAELLSAADALNARVKHELSRAKAERPRLVVFTIGELEPLSERTGRAIEKARAL